MMTKKRKLGGGDDGGTGKKPAKPKQKYPPPPKEPITLEDGWTVMPRKLMYRVARDSKPSEKVAAFDLVGVHSMMTAVADMMACGFFFRRDFVCLALFNNASGLFISAGWNTDAKKEFIIICSS